MTLYESAKNTPSGEAERPGAPRGCRTEVSMGCPCGEDGTLTGMGDPGDSGLRCMNCGLLVGATAPNEAELARWYREAYWEQYAAEQQGAARNNLWIHIMDRMTAVIRRQGTVVDIGCGGGGFLARCRDRGWKGIGFELSEGAVRHARAQQLDVRLAGWPPCTLSDASVEAVTMTNVLDHLADPFSALKEAWRILMPGGLLYLRVPNGPLHAAISRASRRWGAPDLSIRHLYGFGTRSLRFHLARTGFNDIAIRTSPPTQGDAYRQNGSDGARLRWFCKTADRLLYRAARGIGLDRVAYGLSLEATARKPAGAARESAS